MMFLLVPPLFTKPKVFREYWASTKRFGLRTPL